MTDRNDLEYEVPHRPPTWSERGNRLWLYPERRDGKFSKSRKKWAFILILVYLVTPFVTIGGRPLLRFDIEEGAIYAFSAMFRFNDGPYFIFIILSLAMLFFFTTTVKGRFWCGYACPQTVFLEWVIRPIEEWIEGKASKRRKSDRKGTEFTSLWRKVLKYIAFFLVASGISHVFMMYFVAPSTLVAWTLGSPLEHWGPFIVVSGLTALLFFDFFWFREQFCSVLCPYMRFQTVLMDEETPVIAYDLKRGEPRGKGGDCIDCDLCVKVCPTGIDIRDGLQLECIQCGRCADACDTIMVKQETPLGLVRTATMNEVKGRQRKSFRFRPLIYGSAMVIVFTALTVTLLSREEVALTFIRQPGVAFSELQDGRIGNAFRIRMENNTAEPKNIDLSVLSPANLDIICPSCASPLAAYEQRVSVIIFAFPLDGGEDDFVTFANLTTNKEYQLPLVFPHREDSQR